MTTYINVDVRPILRAGGEPFAVIMDALARLEPERRFLQRRLREVSS